MQHKLLIATATVLAAAAFVLFGGALRESPSAGASPVSAERAAAAFDRSFSTARNVGGLVLRLKQEIRANPKDSSSHALLGLAYQQRARETGDGLYYTQSGRALRRALELDRENAVALSGLASLLLNRHRFREGLAFARRARALAPDAARNYGAIGDALLELGRYRKAFAAFDKMARLRPTVGAYARVSYARELLGDRAGAIAAMRLAKDTALPGSEAAAWTAVQLGELFASGGDRRSAAREFRTALAHVPGYAAALDPLAAIEAAGGRLPRAIALERRAVAAFPEPAYVAALGDLLARAGRPAAAGRQYVRVEALYRRELANGIRAGLELSRFQIDHGRDLRAATRMALDAFRSAPTIEAADNVAWGLARTGRCAEAKWYSRAALRLGSENAVAFFHRGMIERCLGNREAATAWLHRALALNPDFSSVWAPVARRYAR